MKIIRAGVLGGHYVPGVTAGVKISGKVRGAINLARLFIATT